MADDEDVTETDAPEGDRLDRLEGKVDALAAAVARLVPGVHKASTEKVEARLDRPSTVEEQVQAELVKAREAEARDKAAADEKSEREQMKADLARLTESKPEPPVPMRQRLLGWSR